MITRLFRKLIYLKRLLVGLSFVVPLSLVHFFTSPFEKKKPASLLRRKSRETSLALLSVTMTSANKFQGVTKMQRLSRRVEKTYGQNLKDTGGARKEVKRRIGGKTVGPILGGRNEPRCCCW